MSPRGVRVKGRGHSRNLSAGLECVLDPGVWAGSTHAVLCSLFTMQCLLPISRVRCERTLALALVKRVSVFHRLPQGVSSRACSVRLFLSLCLVRARCPQHHSALCLPLVSPLSASLSCPLWGAARPPPVFSLSLCVSLGYALVSACLHFYHCFSGLFSPFLAADFPGFLTSAGP